MANFTAPANLANLIGLWDFRSGQEAQDTGLDDGIAQDGEFEGNAGASGDRLHTDGNHDYFDVDGKFNANGEDDAFDLKAGTIEVQFTQDHHVGSSPDTIVNRGEANDFNEEGFFEIRVTQDGQVQAMHCMPGGAEAFLSTSEHFFAEGDTLNVKYSWDEETGLTLVVENLTQNTSTQVESTQTGFNLALGDKDDESFTFGAREVDDGDYDRFFDGSIDYVAIYETTDSGAGPEGPDFIVEGTSGADVIDAAYDGDPEGDMIDANDNQTDGNEDLVDAGAGDDEVTAGQASDTVFAGSGDDTVEGGASGDVIYGDSSLGEADGNTPSVRESFEWDLAPDTNGGGLQNEDPVGDFSQNTGNVTVEFSILSADSGVENEFETTVQNVDDIDDGSETIDTQSSFQSLTNGDGNSASYELDFSDPVENVEFRVNDIDGDGVITVTAFDENNVPVTIELTAGSNLTQVGNTVSGDGNYMSDDAEEYSVFVSIPGPVSRIQIDHSQDGGNNSGVNFTDVYFDAPVAVDPEGPGDDVLSGQSGDDLIYGETGDDSINGGTGNDTLFGDDVPAGTPIGANLILNGSFEDVTGLETTGFGFQGTGAIPFWTEADPSAEIDIHNDGRGNVDPTDGNNWLDLEASPGNNRVGQDVRGIQEGESYQLTFDAGDADFAANSGSGENLVNVYWGGELVGTIDPEQGQMDSFSFVLVGGAGDGSNRLEFEGTGTEDNFGASIDSVELFLLASPTGPAGNDTINGGDGDDVIDGGEEADVINAGNDADLIIGGVGDDIDGGAGGDDNDTLDLTGQGPFFLAGPDGTGAPVPDSNGNGIDGTVIFVDGTGEPTGETITFTEIEVVLGEEVNRPPEAGDDTAETDEDTPVDITVLANDSDPDGDPLEVTEATSPDGDVTINDDGTLTFEPAENFNGPATITYTIEDGNGGSAQGTVTVTVNPVNDDPVAGDDTAETDEDTPVDITVLANDSDVDGDPLEVSEATSPDGDVTINGDGTLTFEPDENFNGETTITYTVIDGQGGSAEGTVTVTVNPVNDDPVAGDDTAETDEDTPVDITVLANDSDVDGDPLEVTEATSPNGDVTINDDGTLTFEPDENFNGETTITYTVIDGQGGSAEGTVTVTVNPVNDDPVANNDSDETPFETAVTVDLLANDTDVDGDDLEVTNVEVTTGSADITDNGDGTVTVTPPEDFAGDIVLTYDISDGNGGTATATHTITVLDDTRDGVVDGEDFEELMNPGYDDSNLPTDGGGDQIDGDDGLDDSIRGNGGDDTINAGLGNDTVDGGDDDDIINGQAGEDSLLGGDGNDTLDGGTEDDVVRGEEGDDSVLGGGGNDSISGSLGNDTLEGGQGNDTISGGSGNDSASGGFGNDSIDGDSGDDTLGGGGGEDTIIGGLGNDSISGGNEGDLIDAGIDGLPDQGFPFETVTPGGDPTLLVGPADPFPNNDLDTVLAGGGNDTIFTGDDDDSINAGQGNDFIDAGFDDDTILAAQGDDTIVAGEGNDSVIGGFGNDLIFGGLGPDAPDIGNVADDGVGSTVGPDPLTDNGDDFIDAGAGNDTVFGEDDDDTIEGGDGNDFLDGGVDEDVIRGEDGDDTIIGGHGADELLGQDDADTFIVGTFGGQSEGIGDTIVGGEGGNDDDTLDLSAAGSLQVILDEDLDPADQIDPGGTPGESGIVIFYADAEQTIETGRLEFSEIENIIPCFTPGALIATPRGEVPVESLREGDKVITRDNGIQEIRWTGNRTLNRDELAEAPNLKPILIKAGSLGHGLPERDMVVSPQHRVLVSGDRTQLYFDESEVLVAAKHLVNGGSIQTMDTLRTTYIHFMFDRHEVVLSDGAWTESFQPGDQTLGAMGADTRDEILALFPELSSSEGIKDYTAARRSLKAHEAKLLQL